MLMGSIKGKNRIKKRGGRRWRSHFWTSLRALSLPEVVAGCSSTLDTVVFSIFMIIEDCFMFRQGRILFAYLHIHSMRPTVQTVDSGGLNQFKLKLYRQLIVDLDIKSFNQQLN